eukprot:scpid87135/ scgid19165/ 
MLCRTIRVWMLRHETALSNNCSKPASRDLGTRISFPLSVQSCSQGELLSDFAETEQKSSRRAYLTVPNAAEDTLARDQFETSSPRSLDSRDLRLHVRGSDPATLADALQRAIHFQ